MKLVKKIITWLFIIWVFSFILSAITSAEDYILFYGNGCPHCAVVENYIKENNIEDTIGLVSKEIFFNKKNRNEFNEYLKKIDLKYEEVWVPFLIIDAWNQCSYINWSSSIIDFFDKKNSDEELTQCESENITWNISEEVSLRKRLSFFWIMLPAAISDSINPCAFAVMFLLLSTILSRHQSRRKTLFSWVMFSFAVFLTYLVMWIWIFAALASATNTFVLKLIVWILWILVWLANIKDYFRYGKRFVMEVPFSRRPKMAELIEKISSPRWAFAIWVLVSLFLLPCSSWPYFTILWYLSAESAALHTRWYIYLIVYNLIFVLPMLGIAIAVAYWYASVDKLAKIKHQKTKLIHLIVGLLMLGLWIYVLTTL